MLCSWPPRTKVTFTVAPAAYSRVAAVSSEASVTLRPPSPVITSPAFKPALSAAEPGVTEDASEPGANALSGLQACKAPGVFAVDGQIMLVHGSS